ncbi:MAG: hypothetical protein J6B49_02855 [Phascolarctobacterium sp.]|nr:hypothetical protein [Phascolarctobacterium sp.]
MKSLSITIRLTNEELMLLDGVVKNGYSPNRSDAIRKAISSFYNTSDLTADQLRANQENYLRYLLTLLVSHTDETGKKILNNFKEELFHGQI